MNQESPATPRERLAGESQFGKVFRFLTLLLGVRVNELTTDQ